MIQFIADLTSNFKLITPKLEVNSHECPRFRMGMNDHKGEICPFVTSVKYATSFLAFEVTQIRVKEKCGKLKYDSKVNRDGFDRFRVEN